MVTFETLQKMISMNGKFELGTANSQKSFGLDSFSDYSTGDGNKTFASQLSCNRFSESTPSL